MKSLTVIYLKPEKKKPFQAESLRIGHHREYTSAYGALEGGKPLKILKKAYARLAYEQQTDTTGNMSAVRRLILVGKQKLNLSRRPFLAWLLKETEFNTFIAKNMVLNTLNKTKTCDEHPRHDSKLESPESPGGRGVGSICACINGVKMRRN